MSSHLNDDPLATDTLTVPLDPSSLMETVETEDGMTYRVIPIDSDQDSIISPPPSYSENHTTSVVDETNRSDDFYLVPQPVTNNEFFSTIPTSKVRIKNINKYSSNNSNVRLRDQLKRANHNEVERRRRENINTWIDKLGKLIPGEVHTNEKPIDLNPRSKGGILARACDYVIEMNKRMEGDYDMNQVLADLEKLKRENNQLKNENLKLKKALSDNGIEVKPSLSEVINSILTKDELKS